MQEKELRRSLSILPIGTVITLTGLTARQIRYYETKELVVPERSQGNTRQFSLNDVDRLLDIKEYRESGLNVDEIKRLMKRKSVVGTSKQASLSDEEARRVLRAELFQQSHFSSPQPGGRFPE